MGQIRGAQQFTKKMLSKNELSISTNSILSQINNFRSANNKGLLTESVGICNLAAKEAETIFGQALESWDQTKMEYKEKDFTKDIINLNEAKKLCPECLFKNNNNFYDNYYGRLNYFILRPDVCSEASEKSNLPCKGDEEYGLTEHYQERILKLWTENQSFKDILLLDNYNLACVRSFGGSVVFSIGVKK
jgi:hypothetical protein